jgi:hypothetical protein
MSSHLTTVAVVLGVLGTGVLLAMIYVSRSAGGGLPWSGDAGTADAGDSDGDPEAGRAPATPDTAAGSAGPGTKRPSSGGAGTDAPSDSGDSPAAPDTGADSPSASGTTGGGPDGDATGPTGTRIFGEGGGTGSSDGATDDTGGVTLGIEGQAVTMPVDRAVGRRIRKLMMSAGHSEQEARRVSREHVEFTRKDDDLYVRDAGSSGGTTLNGTDLPADEWRRVEGGDTLRLADTVSVEIYGPG